jgi:predicted ATPase with chaperone activity
MAASDLLNLVLKTMYTSATETPTLIADVLKLPARIIQQVIEQAQERKLLDVLGSSGIRAMSELRYSLSEKGKQRAIEAMGLNQYIGPAPVSLEAYSERILRQRITNERIDRMSVDKAFSNLVISEKFVRDIGPAINSGRSILLYGPPGNGKTTVSEKIGTIFKDVIYIPYCFEVEGQIIKVYDPGIHKSVLGSADFANKGNVRREDLDGRWVPCRRPNIVTGGELTLSMLDLSFNPLAKFYEAPLHVKALGGIFTIDDFGRQIVTPEALLNRWIVPLESRVDFLQLHTGKNFLLPFDELVIFSTNLSPIDLMDPAFLRRIPYKLEVGAPSRAEYRRIFRVISQAMGMEASDQIIDFVIEELQTRNNFPLASFQPKFIIDQVRAACKFEGVSPQFRPDFITMALANLYTKDTPGYGIVAADEPSAKP